MIQRNDAHKLIEECMIAANVQAATYLLGTGVPAPYRDHDKPPEAKYADLLEFLKEFQLRMPPWAKVRPTDFRKLLETVRERPDAALLDRGGAESVAGRQHDLLAFLAEEPGVFADRGGLAGAVDADDQEDVRAVAALDVDGLCHGLQHRGDLLGQRGADLLGADLAAELAARQLRPIGRAACGERVGKYV